MHRLSIFVLAFLLPHFGGPLFHMMDQPVHQLLGIDVSHHQQRIDWAGVAGRNKIDFAFVKATEGGDFVDSLFCYNWVSLKEQGVIRGAYHFFRPSKDAQVQARHFLETVDWQPGDLAPVLDIEKTDGVAPEVMLEGVRIWLLAVERTLGVRPVLYTNQDFYDKYLAGLFDEYPLWVARYSWSLPVLSSGRSYDFWQFTDKGRLDGLKGHVDLNLFPGDAKMLQRFRIQHPNAVPAVPELAAP
jgi:lysozyme